MSIITESPSTPVVYVQRARAPDRDELSWFSAHVLRAIHRHPHDDTVQYTAKKVFFVRWYATAAEQLQDDTLSVCTMIGHSVTEPFRGTENTTPLNERRETGIRIHRYIECVLNGLPWRDTFVIYTQINAYLQTQFTQHQMRPWRTEMVIRSSTDLRIVGVVDALFLVGAMPEGPTLDLHLKDWKYSMDITNRKTDYELQLNMYKYILESHYRDLPFVCEGRTYTHIHIATMEMVVFHDSLMSHVTHVVPVLTEQVTTLIQRRQNQLLVPKQ